MRLRTAAGNGCRDPSPGTWELVISLHEENHRVEVISGSKICAADGCLLTLLWTDYAFQR